MKIALWVLSVLLVGSAILLALPEGDVVSRVAPYRFAIEPEAPADRDIDFHRKRIAQRPEGLDLAALAGAYLRKARQTGQPRWIEDAERAARASLERLPVSNPAARLALAQAAQMKHDFDRSIALCEEALRDRPRDPRALSLLATAHLGIGRVDEALQAADRLVDRSPLPEHLALRAVVLAARGEEREALHDFQKAVRLEEPGDPEGAAWTRAQGARLHLSRGRIAEARDLLQEALRIRPSHPLALGILGDLEAEAGGPEKADRLYARAFQASGDPVFLLRRARVKSAPADRDELLRAAEKALRDSPGHATVLAQALLERGTEAGLREAALLMEKEAQRRRNVETLHTLARARAATGKLIESRDAFREALRTGVIDARLHRDAADLEERLGNRSRARMHREAAREIRP